RAAEERLLADPRRQGDGGDPEGVAELAEEAFVGRLDLLGRARADDVTERVHAVAEREEDERGAEAEDDLPRRRPDQPEPIERGSRVAADEEAHAEEGGQEEGQLLGDQVERAERAPAGGLLAEDVYRQLVRDLAADQNRREHERRAVDSAPGVDG